MSLPIGSLTLGKIRKAIMFCVQKKEIILLGVKDQIDL